MKRVSQGSFLTAVLVDYDNIYLSLRRKNEEAAKRFSKDAGLWIREIEQGRLITPSNSAALGVERRIVVNRCYGNPVPRRNNHDNSTDMSSFPFVRHHYLRAGFEVIDCPPLTAQLKNSSDIRMVMDVRDLLMHDTYFDEFVILSGDADFTPVLHRLRAHARRTVVFSGTNTAAAYTAISDGEVREIDLVQLLLEGRIGRDAEPDAAVALAPVQATIDSQRRDIIAEVATAVRASQHPIALEVLADRAVRALGHERTAGGAWGGAGSFRDLLAMALPEPLRLSTEAPYVVFDAQRHLAPAAPREEPQLSRSEWLPPIAPPQSPSPHSSHAQASHPQAERPALSTMSTQMSAARGQIAPPQAPARSPVPAGDHLPQPVAHQAPPRQPQAPALPQQAPMRTEAPRVPQQRTLPSPAPAAPPQAAQPLSQPPLSGPPPVRAREPEASRAAKAAPPRQGEAAQALQQSIARIHDACQAPPFSPAEYRALFEAMAAEINEKGLLGAQTLTNISDRAAQTGIEIKRDDVRFLLEVVSEADPWFEQGASANLFAGRFRNFVVARCRGQGLNLSAEELDLIDAWFVGNQAPGMPAGRGRAPLPPQPQGRSAPAAPPSSHPAPQAYGAQPGYGEPAYGADQGGARWPDGDQGQGYAPSPAYQAASPAYQASGSDPEGEEFPRIVRTRLRG